VDALVNKDVLILVLTKQNDELKELVQLQRDQLNGYKKYEELFAEMQANMQRKEEIVQQLKIAYEGATGALERQLQAALDHNVELNKKIEELKTIVDSQTAE
jgi:hypothetical protein